MMGSYGLVKLFRYESTCWDGWGGGGLTTTLLLTSTITHFGMFGNEYLSTVLTIKKAIFPMFPYLSSDRWCWASDSQCVRVVSWAALVGTIDQYCFGFAAIGAGLGRWIGARILVCEHRAWNSLLWAGRFKSDRLRLLFLPTRDRAIEMVPRHWMRPGNGIALNGPNGLSKLGTPKMTFQYK